MTQNDEWGRRLTAVIAEQVKAVRQDRGMSAQQLADATAGLGHPVPRSVLANLENGRRDSIGIAEVLVLARALGVPPVGLVVPLGRTPEVEVLPGTVVPAWDAARWISGEQSLLADDRRTPELSQRWGDTAPALFRVHDRLVEDVWRWDDQVQTAVAQKASSDTVRSWYAMRDDAVDHLRRHRERMRQLGVEPPEVPAGIPLVTDRGEDVLVVELGNPRWERVTRSDGTVVLVEKEADRG